MIIKDRLRTLSHFAESIRLRVLRAIPLPRSSYPTHYCDSESEEISIMLITGQPSFGISGGALT